MPVPTWLSASRVIRAALLPWVTTGGLSVKKISAWSIAGKVLVRVPRTGVERGLVRAANEIVETT
jgi:hypothetical protein